MSKISLSSSESTGAAGVINLPIWRKNCTTIEKLREVLQYAESHPESVKDIMIIWSDENDCRRFECQGDLQVKDAVYALEIAKFDLLKEM